MVNFYAYRTMGWNPDLVDQPLWDRLAKYKLGGTEVNLNVINAKTILEAHQHPSKFPDLIVHVTGFSAYFSSLSPEFRQIVVDRIIAEGQT
jgi:pyruvate-formate lyase